MTGDPGFTVASCALVRPGYANAEDRSKIPSSPQGSADARLTMHTRTAATVLRCRCAAALLLLPAAAAAGRFFDRRLLALDESQAMCTSLQVC